MKHVKYVLMPFFMLLLFSCSKDEISGSGTKSEIKNWASVEVIDAIESLGFVIHEGSEPPNIEGSYSLKKRILQSTNIPNDWAIGSEFFELRFTLSNQDNGKQIIDFDGTEYDLSGNSTEEDITVTDHITNSFVTGSGDNFTAFFKVDETKDSYTATLIYSITGKKTANGLEAFQQGLVMLDDDGSPSTVFIRNNQGRIFKDNDGVVSKL